MALKSGFSDEEIYERCMNYQSTVLDKEYIKALSTLLTGNKFEEFTAPAPTPRRDLDEYLNSEGYTTTRSTMIRQYFRRKEDENFTRATGQRLQDFTYSG